MKIINVAEPAIEAARLRRATAMPESLFTDAMAIMKAVAEQGDSAVLDFTAKFDGSRPDSLLISRHEMKQAYDQVLKCRLMRSG